VLFVEATREVHRAEPDFSSRELPRFAFSLDFSSPFFFVLMPPPLSFLTQFSRTQDYITKSYQVVKTNAKAKKQTRLIKFTLNSLLNIDPKTRRIQNERNLTEIKEIFCRADGSGRAGEQALVELEVRGAK
jgi:hypothetical protein